MSVFAKSRGSLASVMVCVVILSACSGGAASPTPSAAGSAAPTTNGTLPTIVEGLFVGENANPASVMASQKSLLAMVPAQIRFVPITAGVTALAAMKAGSFEVISDIGNPPVVTALVNDTPIKVVYAVIEEHAGLYINTKVIGSESDLAGKNIGSLTGSSQEYELKGYLTVKGLLDKVTVVPFASNAASAAAFLAGKLDAVYVDFGNGARVLEEPDTKLMVTASQIGDLGYPGINVLVVSAPFAAANKEVVQGLVCAFAKAIEYMNGPNKDEYFAAAAPFLGETVDQAIKGSANIHWLTLEEQADWFGQPGTPIEQSKLINSLSVAATYLQESGTLSSQPSSSAMADALDSSYVNAAVEGACGG